MTEVKEQIRVIQNKFNVRRPKRSLRTILLISFLLLSLLPLMFVTGYSLIKYEQAIDNELVQRLRANVREFTSTVNEYGKYLEGRRSRHQIDASLLYYVSTDSVAQVKQVVRESLRNALISRLSVFDREGQLIASFSQDANGEARENHELENANIYLADSLKEELLQKGQIEVTEVSKSSSLELVGLTQLKAKTGRLAGYLEEIITITPSFLENLKKRLNLEIILFDQKGNIVAGSHPDFVLYQKDFFAKTIQGENEALFDLVVRGEPFGFIISPVKWGNHHFLIGLGASKQKAKNVLRNINFAFFTVIGAIGILLILVSIITARAVFKPLNDLVEGLHKFETQDMQSAALEIPVTSDTEIGLLTESFNEMSLRIYRAKRELENKVKELESANLEIKEAQSRLVHTAKMASLGQLVAGIAHELNNPIGFIYSNMGHLRDYAERLKKIIDSASGSTSDAATEFEQLKIELEYDYIIKDLPRLITSCEDGARRTRDIVLGLRNFSRLEEAVLKKVDLREGIENTLHLLAGETKGRIRVHTEFAPVPEVLCYASQMNQVFMNLLSNAAQAIDGEGDIWISLSGAPLGSSGGSSAGSPMLGDQVQISIKDSGKGMSSETIEKIFDPFFTTKSIGQGTGLGLSISYGIVKKHGGDIQVRSTLGKGTEFIISIPIHGAIEK
jgi:two-component system NtrC family sensor kinase